MSAAIVTRTPRAARRAAGLAGALALLATAIAAPLPARAQETISPRGSVAVAPARFSINTVWRVAERLELQSEAAPTSALKRVAPPMEPNVGYEFPSFVPPPPPASTSTAVPARPEGVTSFSYTPHLRESFIGVAEDGYPPDPHMAAGPGHLVAVTNRKIMFFDKTGARIDSTTLTAFTGAATGAGTNTFDPKVIYDEQSGRFFFTCLTYGTTTLEAWVQLAVSKNSDPTQGWWVYSPSAGFDSCWVDYPEIGVSPHTASFYGNYLRFPGVLDQQYRSFNWVWDKAAMMNGQALTLFWFPDLGGFKPANVPVDPPGAPDGYMMSNPVISPSEQRIEAYGIVVPPTWPAGSPTVTRQSVSQPFLGPMPNAAQLGGLGRLSANNIGSPILNAVYRNGVLYGIAHYPFAGGSMLRLHQIDVSGWPSISLTNLDVHDGGVSYYFYGSVGVNQRGDVASCFSRSGPSVYGGAYFANRYAGESFFPSLGTLKAGEDYYGSYPDSAQHLFRWGDYSASAVDPVDQSFWFFHEYARVKPNSMTGRYGTWIGHMVHAVFVDGSYFGPAIGTPPMPFNTVAAGYAAAYGGNDLVVRAGTYPGPLILNKRLDVIPDGGIVQLGP
jgi:hypothetical protein